GGARAAGWRRCAGFERDEVGPRAGVGWEGLLSMGRGAGGRPQRPKIGLWRLDEDPREDRNLVWDDPASVRAVYAMLTEHRAAHPPRLVASSTTPGLDARGRRALRALGYVQ